MVMVFSRPTVYSVCPRNVDAVVEWTFLDRDKVYAYRRARSNHKKLHIFSEGLQFATKEYLECGSLLKKRRGECFLGTLRTLVVRTHNFFIRSVKE